MVIVGVGVDVVPVARFARAVRRSPGLTGRLFGAVAAAAAAREVTRWQVTLSHAGGMVVALVVAESA